MLRLLLACRFQHLEEICQRRFDVKVVEIQQGAAKEVAKAQRAAAEAKEHADRMSEALKALNAAFASIRSDSSAVRALSCVVLCVPSGIPLS
jgi:hypothetical protein